MRTYSVIVPVYNRPQEVDELLESLVEQECQDFDVILVEDGSTESSEGVVKKYESQLDIKYFYKKNTGPGDSRNFGMSKATGDYLIFFDSDCVIPSNYFVEANAFLDITPLDAWGGPDDAHPSFTNLQKAINHTMTSFFTTGGIRGRKKSVGKFQPRSFNMGFTKEVYRKVGGFGDIHPGEDPDLSFRIMNEGFTTGLLPDAKVFHKRRIDFSKFAKQVYKFGATRIILSKWHKGTFKPVYAMPAMFTLGVIGLLMLSVSVNWMFVLPLALFSGLVFIECLLSSKNIIVSFLSVPAAYIQLFSYGYGFLQATWIVTLLNRDERKAMPYLFFDKVKDYR